MRERERMALRIVEERTRLLLICIPHHSYIPKHLFKKAPVFLLFLYWAVVIHYSYV